MKEKQEYFNKKRKNKKALLQSMYEVHSLIRKKYNMKIFKYTNKIDTFNVLEAVLIATNYEKAVEMAKKINESYSWGNQDKDEIKPIEMKEGLVIISVNND